MGTKPINWTPIGSKRPASIEAAPLLARAQLERLIWAEHVADQLGEGEPAGQRATALVLGTAALGTLIIISSIATAMRAWGG